MNEKYKHVNNLKFKYKNLKISQILISKNNNLHFEIDNFEISEKNCLIKLKEKLEL